MYGSVLAEMYDKWNDMLDYGAWAEFVFRLFDKHSQIPVKNVLEIACGTGSMTAELVRKGYDVIASDISSEMLSGAEKKLREAGLKAFFVEADMRCFTLAKKVDACVCTLDSINYLTKPCDFVSCLESAKNALNDGGLFLFDTNSKYKFENVYADNAYSYEEDGIFCTWQNFYDPEKRLCDICITLFKETPEGLYERSDEEHRERMYTVRSVKRMLERAGLEFCGVYGDYNFREADEESDERLYWVARKPKK